MSENPPAVGENSDANLTKIPSEIEKILEKPAKKSPRGVFKHQKVQSEAARQRDASTKNRQQFADFVEYFCRRNSLRASLTRTEHDYEKTPTLDHSYNGKQTQRTSTTAEKKSFHNAPKKHQFIRQLFVNRYENSPFFYTNSDEVLNSGNEIDVVGNLSPLTNEFSDVEIVDFFAQEAEKYARKIKEILHKNSASSAATYELPLEEILKESTPVALRKTVEKLFKIIFDYIYVMRSVEQRLNAVNMKENCRYRSATRLRLVLAPLVGDKTSLGAVHSLLLRNLGVEPLSIYIGLLKILKQQIPEVVQKICGLDPQVAACQDETSRLAVEIFKEYFDGKSAPPHPLSDVVNFRTLPVARNPLFILISPHFKVYGHVYNVIDRSYQFYRNLLPQLGKCYEIKFPPFKKDITYAEVNEKLFTLLSEKLIEIKVANPSRRFILVGWDTSCFLALTAALEFPVAACVCLAYPNVTLNGIRGDVDDDILEVSCPVLFVVGQFSSTCSLDDVNDTKDNMKSDKVGLIVVGGANNELHVSQKKLSMENLTQRIVDKCIMDNVSEFLNDVLVALPQVPSGPSVRLPVEEHQFQQTVVGDEQYQIFNQPDAKRRSIDVQQLSIKIPTAASAAETNEPTTNAEGANLLSSVYNPATDLPAIIEHPSKIQQRQRNSAPAATSGYAESPLGAYATSSGNPPPTVVSPGDDDASATRTRQIKKRQILDL